MLCIALISRGLIDKDWIEKPQVDVNVARAGSGPMIHVKVNDIKSTAILDTGSTFTLIPHAVWLMLNLNSNVLDQSVKFNINSASHRNDNAVLGTVKLSFAIKDNRDIWQFMDQKCLILRPALQLAYILLGDDFLSANLGSITYMEKGSRPQAKINGEIIPLVGMQNASKAHFIESFFSLDQRLAEPTSETPAVIIHSHQAEIQTTPPHATFQPSQQCTDDLSPRTPR